MNERKEVKVESVASDIFHCVCFFICLFTYHSYLLLLFYLFISVCFFSLIHSFIYSFIYPPIHPSIYLIYLCPINPSQRSFIVWGEERKRYQVGKLGWG